MDANTLQRDPSFDGLARDIANYVREHLPRPDAISNDLARQAKQLSAKLIEQRRKVGETRNADDIDLAPFFRLLQVPDNAHRAVAHRIGDGARGLAERLPELAKLSDSERSRLVGEAVSKLDWMPAWLSEITGLGEATLAPALIAGREQPAGPKALSENCELNCLIAFVLALEAAIGGALTLSITCASGFVLPGLAFLCLAMVGALYLVAVSRAHRAYKECLLGCEAQTEETG